MTRARERAEERKRESRERKRESRERKKEKAAARETVSYRYVM